MDGLVAGVRNEIEARVVEILASQALCDAGSLTPETRLADLGIDSLGLAEVLFAVEERFDISVPFNANRPDEGAGAFSSVGAVCAAIEALVRNQKG